MEKKVTKILFCITKSNWGGAQRYVFDLATSLPKEQFEVSVAFGQFGRLAEELRKARIPIHEVQSLSRDISLGADIRGFLELLALFKKEHPDIVHLNSSKAGGLGSAAARLAGVPHIIFTAHGWPFWEKRSGIARGLIWISSWLTALFSHSVITVSDYDTRVAGQMPLVGARTTRIYNGIDSIEFLPQEERSGEIRVLTNAELTHNKNLFTGIDAVALAREGGAPIHYTLMGDGELRRTLEEYVKEKAYGDFVTFLGFVPDGKRHYKKFDIFFLPSKKEGLPYVLLEAGLASLPVIASNVGGIPEIIQDGRSGILALSGDTVRFAEALKALAGDMQLRETLGQTLKERIAREFSLEQMIKKTEAIYYRS